MDTQPEIVYECEDFAVLNKPYGVNFDWALESRKDFMPVHRLDKDTSGIIIFAKNKNAQEYFKSLFQAREIKKTYIALVTGSVKASTGAIDWPIGRSKKTPLKRVAIGEQRGKIREALTEYKVLKRIGGFTLVEAHPKTGRTHQIRSHFAAIGHPVVCDKLYAGKRFVCPAGLKRQFLHASAIEFTPPAGAKTGSRLRLEADLPSDLKNAIFFLCHH